ncbi:MAG: hypothetical protein HQ547_07085 [Candidatus Omnitrophica bacterium]|nr:hypothetical protein [Candidatus Omnitrophota bacterium]
MTRIKTIALMFFLICGITYLAMPALAQDIEMTAPPVTEEEETDIVAGKVTALDVANDTLVVTDEADKPYTLVATKEDTSIWKGDDTIDLSGLTVDDSIELEYYKGKDGKLIAIWIDVLLKQAVLPEEIQPVVSEEPEEVESEEAEAAAEAEEEMLELTEKETSE